MTSSNDFKDMVDNFERSPPDNAISLRSASAQIVSGWINSGRTYPNELIDGFVYIESSIERSIEENLSNAIALERDTKDAYQFHIGKFIDLLGILKENVSTAA